MTMTYESIQEALGGRFDDRADELDRVVREVARKGCYVNGRWLSKRLDSETVKAQEQAAQLINENLEVRDLSISPEDVLFLTPLALTCKAIALILRRRGF